MMSCPVGAAMMTPVALLSCEKKRNFTPFSDHNWTLLRQQPTLDLQCRDDVSESE